MRRNRSIGSRNFKRSVAASDAHAIAATRCFFHLLGQFAREFALAYGATDGVFIAGGVAQRYPKMLKSSSFREAFVGSGRLATLMGAIPTALITHEEPGLLGRGLFCRGVIELLNELFV